MKVSVIVVNYNTKEITLACLASVIKFTKDIDYEIVLVDNASTDGSQEAIAKQFPAVHLIKLNTNIGFGRANNLGCEKAQGEFLFFLNSDTILLENSILKFYDFFVLNEARLRIGVLGCLLVGNDLSINGFGSQFPSPSALRKESLNKLPLIKKFVNLPSIPVYDKSKEYFQIDYVIGADMFLRRKLFREFSGFDKDYFMYFEESDLQLRLNRDGFKNYIYTGTRIIHLEDGSGKVQIKYSNKKRIILHRSKIFYMKKNFPHDYLSFSLVDGFVLLTHLFNRRYAIRENLDYIKQIIQTY